ncbi:MAG: FAD-binding oxidoreductase [Oscillospiraceae bacterium]
MNKTAEIVIVGGGISGCAIAYELAKAGMKNIVVIEKKYLTSGATGRCGAGIRMQWGTELNCKLSKYALNRFETLNDELEYEFDIELNEGGYLMIAATDHEMEQFKKNVALENSLGIPSKMVDVKECLEIVPHLAPEHIVGGSYCGKDGHLNPFHTTQAYANAAERLGVTFLKNTSVTGIDVENGKIKGVHTDKDYIATNKVVNCAGAWSQEISKMVGVPIDVYSQRHQILVTEPVAHMQDPMVMGFAHNIYSQQVPQGSFVMGRSDNGEPMDGRMTSSWQFLDEMSKTLCKLMPVFKNISIVRQWAGMYNMTPDRQPIYGTVDEVEGYYLAVGFSGHGFMFGPVTGKLMSECILGKEYTIDISALSYDRFAKGNLFVEPSVV